jgi:cytoskeletal protein CcmA (bactofilin family)
MFKAESTKTVKDIETIIGPSVKVEGDFFGEGDVVVEGIVTGNLKTKNNLKIMEGAKIQAEIEAKNAFVAGEVSGNISVQNDLELTASAKVKGDITANLLSIERGALINGKITMGTPASLKKEKEDKIE